MLNETELQEIETRRDAADQVVDDLCHGRRDWTMNVPARADSDPDLVIAAALRDNTALLSTVRELQRQNDTLTDIVGMCRAAAGWGTPDDPMNVHGWSAMGDPAEVPGFIRDQFRELQRQVREREALINDIREWDINDAAARLMNGGGVKLSLPIELRQRIAAMYMEQTP